MKEGRQQVQKIAALSKLNLSSEELEKTVTQFEQIIDYFRKLEEVETEQVEPTYQTLPESALETPLRADKTTVSLPADEAVAEASSRRDQQFRVPRVIE